MTKDPEAGTRLARGARCRELAQSPMFMDAVEALDAEYRTAMFQTLPEARDLREQLFLEYHALRRVIKRLKAWEQDGVLAQAEMDSK